MKKTFKTTGGTALLILFLITPFLSTQAQNEEQADDAAAEQGETTQSVEQSSEQSQNQPENEPQNPQLDVEEVRSTPVRFSNRSNRLAGAALRQEDNVSGLELAEGILKEKSAAINRIKVRRIFAAERAGRGADILEVDAGANFGHINRLQRILAAYLVKAFQYSASDAVILSRFVLYYNARKRGDLNTIKERYSEPVVATIDPQRVGIDRSFQNWAGKTQLLLPLRKSIVRPGGGDLDRSEIRQELDAAPPAEQQQFEQADRRRSEDEKARLAQKEAELQQERERLQQERARAERERAEIAQEKEEIGKRLLALRQDPQKNRAQITEAEKEQTALQEREQQVEQQTREIEEQEEGVAAQQQETQEQQQQVEEQQQEIERQEQQQDIAAATTPATPTEDSQEELEQQRLEELQRENERLRKEKEEQEKVSANVVQDKILFMRVVRHTPSGHYQNELWYLDAAKDDTLFRSSYTNICSRDFLITAENNIVVTGYEGDAHERSDHKLVLLDIDKLEKKGESKELVHWSTPFHFRDGKIYVFEQKGEQYYLARFNTNLTFDARTNDAVNPYAQVTFYKNKIYLTGSPANNEPTTIQVFQRTDLQTLKTIRP